MCRWAAWIGAPLFLDQIISRPDHSLIVQSQRAEECKTAINADGFGVAWYGEKQTPGLYRDVFPAWSDRNLRSIAEQVSSRLFLAHVRASTGSSISRDNCHPFVSGKWSFMHNGQIGGFDSFRKRADMGISDDLYAERKGTTDSEAIFMRALSIGLDRDPIGAMQQSIREMQELSAQHGTLPHMRASAAYSDGRNLYALRYSSDHIAPSLYYRKCAGEAGFMVVSEPLETSDAGWIAVPAGTICRFDAESVETFSFDVTPKVSKVA